MDIWEHLSSGDGIELQTIKTIDMHTSGEPTRIVISGCPELKGRTLLEKRAFAREKMDHLRKRLMMEPRGHAEMYGALLVRHTELTENGEADIGVLFMHNEGYSTMCGHATIALGRFLVDTHDERIFPQRGQLIKDERGDVELRLHAPCGVVRLGVPVMAAEGRGLRSDPTCRVRFVSVPSFVSARDVLVEIPEEARWTALRAAGRTGVRVDVAYGGAFYAFVSAAELGFTNGLRGTTVRELDAATAAVKRAVAALPGVVAHPSERALEYLYGVIVTEGPADDPATDGGLSACFFADQQLDRSPTGSGVSARVALAVAAGKLSVGEPAEFHSLVSMADAGSAFTGAAVETAVMADGGDGGRQWDAVRVEVSGRAFYTGAHAFVAETGDGLAGAGVIAPA